MGNPHADRFLTCVLHRSRSDMLVRIGMLFVITAVIPGLMLLLLVILLYIDRVTNPDCLVALSIFMCLLISYIIYRMFRILHYHHVRDMIWMDSLTSYAESKGKDVSELRSIMNESEDTRSEQILRILYCIAMVQGVVAVLEGLYVIQDTQSMGILSTTFTAFTIIILVETAFVSSYQFVKIRRYDDIQCRFTVEFSELFRDELGMMPMVTGITVRRLWPHVVLMFATLGIYVVIFALWTIHTLNVHQSRQWTYEEELVKGIAGLEGATGIIPVKADLGEGWMAIVNGFRW